jgi:hypothetical protein
MGEPPPNYGMEERHQLLNHDERLILGVRRSVFYRRSRQVRIAVGILLALGFVSLLQLVSYLTPFTTTLSDNAPLQGSVQPRRLLPSSSYSYPEPHTLATFQTCSINSFLSTGLPFLETASHLPVSEFVERRNNLAKALVADGIDAFTVEPGYTFKYVRPIHIFLHQTLSFLYHSRSIMLIS